MRALMVAAVLAECAAGQIYATHTPQYGYEVVHAYPHDRGAFTEGLFYMNGFLYESTGRTRESSVRKVKLETGEVLQLHQLPDEYFGEGIVKWNDKLYQLTWQTELGFIYDFNTFAVKGQFHYKGEGWAFTTDGKRIYMDDGTAQIRIWDPETLQETGRITVTDEGRAVDQLNELEWVKGEIFANIWETNRIARIDPKTGKVVGWIDLSGLLKPGDIDPEHADANVLNGIAYDAARGRLFVTGKCWPKVFEIKLVRKSPAAN
jgi:glutaminyl-peptide cyclotransferase